MDEAVTVSAEWQARDEAMRVERKRQVEAKRRDTEKYVARM